LHKELSSSTYDIIQFHHSPLAEYLPAIPDGFQGSTVINLHNVETLLLQRLSETRSGLMTSVINKIDAVRMKRFEAVMLPRFDQVHTVSDDENQFLRREFLLQEVMTIPNGIDWLPEERGGYMAGANDAEYHLLFCGSLKYPPNQGGAIWFAREVMPLLRASGVRFVFNIVGHDPSELIFAEQTDDVIVHGYVEDLEPLYRASIASVIPLFHGGGTRHKALESLTYFTSIISTEIGVEGLGLIDGDHYLRAETSRDFAKQILESLKSDTKSYNRIIRARTELGNILSWEAIGVKLRSAYADLISGNSIKDKGDL